MRIDLELPNSPPRWVLLGLNALTQVNRAIFLGTPRSRFFLPPVVYQRERKEIWKSCDAILRDGFDDCDGLSTWRAGELEAAGWLAIFPFEEAYEIAQAYQPETIAARVVLEQTGTRLFHAITRYQIVVDGDVYEFTDDPSARLGMLGKVAPEIKELRYAR
ncbi:MAG: hypothetical protein IPI35_35470 [Deltaproteobacteria bacterium]|nr:hypothetical protein [Deltaproteobacteria bacterium]